MNPIGFIQKPEAIPSNQDKKAVQRKAWPRFIETQPYQQALGSLAFAKWAESGTDPGKTIRIET